MLKPEFTGQFKRDYKLAVKRGCDPKKMETVISMLCNEGALPESYRDYALTNSRNYKDMRECHIQPDWLLVYKIVNERLILKLIRTGTHSDLFLIERRSSLDCCASLCKNTRVQNDPVRRRMDMPRYTGCRR